MPLAIRQPPEVEQFLRQVREEILDADLADPAATLTVITVLVDLARQVADITIPHHFLADCNVITGDCRELNLIQAISVAVVEAWDERLAKAAR